MKILESHIHRVSRDRDFGRVEAIVSVNMQYHPHLPPRLETVLASVPARGVSRLRTRLVEEARRVAVLLHRSDRGQLTQLAA